MSSLSSSSSNSPCAACKIQRRKCTQECVFAPYFPPDNPQRFAYVHKVFGASNVAKLLNELNAAQREDAVKSLAYEAEARLRDPVYGCVGVISILQHNLKQLQTELNHAKKELASYIGPNALFPPPPLQQPPRTFSLFPFKTVSTHQDPFGFNDAATSASHAGFNHLTVISPSHAVDHVPTHTLAPPHHQRFLRSPVQSKPQTDPVFLLLDLLRWFCFALINKRVGQRLLFHTELNSSVWWQMSGGCKEGRRQSSEGGGEIRVGLYDNETE